MLCFAVPAATSVWDLGAMSKLFRNVPKKWPPLRETDSPNAGYFLA